MKQIQRYQFTAMVNPILPCLEIGPYARPTFQKGWNNVKYADILTAEQIRAVCAKTGYDPRNTPEVIDILINPEDKPAIKTDEKFFTVFSSHNIEHQVNIIRHLNEIANITTDDGKYYLIIPDKRYCFDHYQQESSVAQMVAADLEDRRKHTTENILQTMVYETHNDTGAHWAGKHGPNQWSDTDGLDIVKRMHTAMEKVGENKSGYFDCHAWYFTPTSFFRNIMLLRMMNMIPWIVNEVYDTVPGTNEFFAILEKK